MPRRKRSSSPNLDLLEDGFDDELSSNDEKPGTPIQRNAANARERARMRVLSKAFFNLKRNIPWVPADTKLSKLDTLRLAKNYISYLAATLDGQSVEDFSTNLAQPPKTAWPFIFQPVQTHEPSKSKLVPVVATHGSYPEKWPNTHSCGVTKAASLKTEHNIKSQKISPLRSTSTSAASKANGPFAPGASHFMESQTTELDHHQHTLQHTASQHLQQHSFHHQSTANNYPHQLLVTPMSE
ncbi:neurogenic differentiation factor 1 [Toxorhynchites rutilus septentrionalis]|uniref:neurogenic differentiation factor 1 n=1 Tax=Toxorhynchites rutilus septentrionalis TaxID=329112 RepID=UPI002479702C|nr:neurogenic differentiation factor 1 [Toxorhynchites rutilus septentrionalis]